MEKDIKIDLKEIIDNVTEKIQKNAQAKAIFGDPIEKDGITVIPIARVCVSGFGGGGGGEDETKKKGEKQGAGLGLGVRSKTSPVGYIEISEEGTVYKEITDRNRMIMSGMLLGGFAIFSLTRLIRKLFK